MKLSAVEQKKQELYRDARVTDKYDQIWQTVGKCAFCELKEKYIFFEEHGVVMTISLYAYIDGHFMIIPRRHVRSVKELTQLEWETVRKFTYIAKKIIREVHNISGMQVVQKTGVTAQSTVEHIHFHCIPFDAPDLCQWNYRQLKHTPLENVELYKKAHKKIVKADLKFENSYKQSSSLPVVCDLAIVNHKNEVLMQVRQDGARFSPASLSLPGGGVDDFTISFEQELVREVKEETGIVIKPRAVKLIRSRVADLKIEKRSVHLAAEYYTPKNFIWNTYLLTDFDPKTPMSPADDCKELLWIPLKGIAKHPRLSPSMRQTLSELPL